MEDKKIVSTKGCCGDCGHRRLLCWAIGLVVLMIVFCAGFKLGELKAYFHSYYGQDYYGYQTGGMMRWGYPNNGYGYGMMGNWRNYDGVLPAEQTVSEATTATSTK